jgi:hypothetical protein
MSKLSDFDLDLSVGHNGEELVQSLLTGGLSAAKTAQAGNSYSPFGTAIQGLSSNQQLTNALGQWASTPSQSSYGASYGTGGFGNSVIPAYNPFSSQPVQSVMI